MEIWGRMEANGRRPTTEDKKTYLQYFPNLQHFVASVT